MEKIKMIHVARERSANPMRLTGNITTQPIIGTDLSRRFLIKQVNFARGEKNRFHSHSIEQILVATEGKGIAITEKEGVALTPGDIVFIPAGEKHRHGAAEGNTFSSLVIMSPDNKTTWLDN